MDTTLDHSEKPLSDDSPGGTDEPFDSTLGDTTSGRDGTNGMSDSNLTEGVMTQRWAAQQHRGDTTLNLSLTPLPALQQILLCCRQLHAHIQHSHPQWSLRCRTQGMRLPLHAPPTSAACAAFSNH